METGNTNGSKFKTPKIVTLLPVETYSAMYGAVPRSVWRDPASKYFTASREMRYICIHKEKVRFRGSDKKTCILPFDDGFVCGYEGI